MERVTIHQEQLTTTGFSTKLSFLSTVDLRTAIVISRNVSQSNAIHIYIYAVQQDKQSFLMIEFYSSHMLARQVSDLNGPSSGAFFL